MSRFQAMTTALLDEELDILRHEMGLNESQKAELLRELTYIASWVVSQARAGRSIEACGQDGVEVFHHPALTTGSSFHRIVLAPDETERLSVLFDNESGPSPALCATLRRIADPERHAPALTWSKP